MDIFTDKQLQTATWLYIHRPLLNRIGVYFFGTLGAVLVIFLVFNSVLFLTSYASHNEEVIVGTQRILLYEDPALQFAPQHIEALSVTFAKHDEGRADFVAEAVNKNSSWYAASFQYSFAVDGVSLPVRTGYALPGDTFFITGFKTDKTAFSAVTLSIDDVNWRRVYREVDKRFIESVDILVEESFFVKGNGGDIVDTVQARIRNNMPFSFWRVDVIALAYKNGDLVAVGERGIEQMISGEVRTVDIGMGVLESKTVDRIMVIPHVNMLDPANIM